MRDQRVYLKVKIKSLSAEAGIIRIEEQRNKHLRDGLTNHRRMAVRNESRHTLLAYGFLKGRLYSEMETGTTQPVDWDKVKKMVEKYGVYYTEDVYYADLKAAREQQAVRFDAWKPQVENIIS